jgi:hypothetical protein
MYRRLMAVVLLVGASRAVAAQDTALLIPNDREASAQVVRIVASAEAAGLPTNPIVGKVQYGVRVARSKPSVIVASASQVAARLELARTALEPNASQLEIEAGANALAEKATPAALMAVRRASGNRPVVVPLSVLTQLLSSKVKLERATEIVTDLIKRGATTPQLVALGNDVADDARLGTPGAAAAEVRVRGLIAVLAARGVSFGDKVSVTAPAVGDGFNTTNTRGSPPPPPRRP